MSSPGSSWASVGEARSSRDHRRSIGREGGVRRAWSTGLTAGGSSLVIAGAARTAGGRHGPAARGRGSGCSALVALKLENINSGGESRTKYSLGY